MDTLQQKRAKVDALQQKRAEVDTLQQKRAEVDTLQQKRAEVDTLQKKSRGGHATTKKSRGGHAKTKKENIVPLLHVRKKKHARRLIFLRCSYAAPFHFFFIFYNQNDKKSSSFFNVTGSVKILLKLSFLISKQNKITEKRQSTCFSIWLFLPI